MKKTTLISACCLLFGVSISAQEIPENVKQAFADKYPNMEEGVWQQDDDGYEVEFKLNGNPAEAEFSANGDWLETEKSLRPRELPKDILKKAKKNYPGYKVSKAEWVESAAEGTYYELDLEGAKTLELKVFSNGKMSVEELREDEDDEELDEE